MFEVLFSPQQKTMKSKRGGGGGGGGFKVRGKMDKRGSRSVMFENDGIRMRNYDVSAEIEKGHSDLRKLKKENETLKQQVWTLRDEYDKLETIVKNMESSGSSSSSCSEDDSTTEHDCPDSSSLQARRHSTLSRETMDGVDLLEDNDNIDKIYATPRFPHHSKGRRDEYPPSTSAASNTNVGHPEHFNLDQLLDFASSFHYDRRKHLTTDEPSTVAVTLPNVGEGASPTIVLSDKNKAGPSGYPPIRRRSATVIEQVSNGATAAVIKEMKDVTICDETIEAIPTISSNSGISAQTTAVTYTRSSSYYFSSSLDGSRSQSLGAGLNSTGSLRPPLCSSDSSTNLKNGSSLDAGLPLVSVFPPRAPLVRLSSIEPNTMMISVVEMPHLWDITTQEIIDELEQQVGPSLPDIHGVRVAGRAAYVSLGRRETLQQLMRLGLTVRGNIVPLIDVTRESVVVGLTGVPHYIADGTLFILLAAFGTIIGEIERRFYKGVDTGERFVRMKLKNLVKLPKYVTVGGCRIVLTVHDRIGSIIPDWASNMACGTTNHLTSSRASKSTAVSAGSIPDVKICSDRSKYEGVEGSIVDNGNCKDKFFSNDGKPPKTFSSRCVVNLKIPDRISATGAIPRIIHREAPPPPTLIAHSPLSPGQVLRVGSLDRKNRPMTTRIPTSSSSSHPPIPPHPQPSTSFDNQPRPPSKPPMQTPKNPQTSEQGKSPSAQEGTSTQQTIKSDAPLPPSSQASSDGARARPSSVVFDETPRESSKSQPPTSNRPLPLSNGILRRGGSVTQEQEALIPSRQTTTATIRSRLRLGAPRPAQPSQRTRGQGRQLGRMESISENTISEDVNDITPLGGRSRRDSERSSVSGTSKTSSVASKPRRDVIDLPWCGCWGNGCI